MFNPFDPCTRATDWPRAPHELTRMSLSLEGEQTSAQILKQKPLSTKEVEKNVREFLKRRQIAENLSAEDYSRLYCLQEALVEEEAKRNTLKRKKREAESEAEEPDRKKSRRRRIT